MTSHAKHPDVAELRADLRRITLADARHRLRTDRQRLVLVGCLPFTFLVGVAAGVLAARWW